MKNASNVILSTGIASSLCGMLGSSFLTQYYTFDNYFLLYPLSIGICLVGIIAFFSFLINRISLRISILDIIMSVIVFYYIIRYDYELQLANWKIIYAILLLILWFAVRILLTNIIVSRTILFGGIVFIGCLLTVWGLLQLYGLYPSNHSLFAITGPFYNPGPYSGYLAMIFPISLSCLLQSGGKTRYLWLLAFSLIFCILPAGMSRSAWLALSISSAWVLGIYFNWFAKARHFLRTQHCKAILYSVLVTAIIVSLSILFFRMKTDSGNGRLFIWKITSKVIADKPLFGYGPGAFSHVYGEMQSGYFASGHYTALEEKVAGAPEYAFNEYLQLGVEGGIILLAMFLFLVVWGIRKGISKKEYAACSGLISLLIFALSSYPFQILPFLMLGVLLLAICISNDNDRVAICSVHSKIYTTLLLAIMLGGNVFSIHHLRNVNELSDRLYYIKELQDQSMQKEVMIGYGRLYDFFKYKYNFLFGYAKNLYEQKKYDEAIVILERAKLVSCHPNIYNLQGQCYQAAGYFVAAERCYKKSSHLLPIRIYPYYLLAKLYAEPSFFNRIELQKMADIVLSKEPKVYSKAIDEMHFEIKVLLKKNQSLTN